MTGAFHGAHIRLLQYHVSESATDALDTRESVEDLLGSIDVRFEDAHNVLEILALQHDSHLEERNRTWKSDDGVLSSHRRR